MEIHGIPWNSMAFHGNPWNSMEIHGILWKSIEFHGILRHSMEYCVYFKFSIEWMESHGKLVPILHGIPSTIFYGIPYDSVADLQTGR